MTQINISAPLIELQNCGVLSDQRWLVRNINLSLFKNEIVTLIGPNGSGKSTTIKLALGIIKPNEGKIIRQKGLKIGYVPQSLAIDRNLPLTVRRLMELTGKIEKEAIEQALTEVDLLPFIDASVQTLSAGEFQRALLARAIARKPDLLVLDEPTSGVDFQGELALYELISKIRQRHECGIIMISHDLHIVMAATDRVICMNGHICCEGTPISVSRSDAYKHLFAPKQASALAVYEHVHDHTHHLDGCVEDHEGKVEQAFHEGHNHHHHHHHHVQKSDTSNNVASKEEVSK